MRLIACLLAACLVSSPVVAQEAVTGAYRAALAETPTPTLLRLAQEDWLKQWSQYPDERAGMEEMRLGELRALAARDRAIRADRRLASSLASDCIDTRLLNCAVDQSGSLTLADGTPVWFQQQSGFTEEDGSSTAMVVLQAEGDRLKPIFWLAGPVGVLPVETLRGAQDQGDGTYVVLPAYGQGTGSQWVGTMFRWNGPSVAPTEIDVQSWLNTLPERLPEGLGVWKGPRFYWAWMSAQSPLWQDSDANCCATGGEVFFDLAIEGDVLSVSGMTVRDAILSVAASVEPEVLGWVSRYSHCAHWTGEEPADDARRAEIEAAVVRLRCDALDTDEAALRAAFADRDGVSALLNRARAADQQ